MCSSNHFLLSLWLTLYCLFCIVSLVIAIMCSRADNDIITILGQYKLVVDKYMPLATGLLSGENNYSRLLLSCDFGVVILEIQTVFFFIVSRQEFINSCSHSSRAIINFHYERCRFKYQKLVNSTYNWQGSATIAKGKTSFEDQRHHTLQMTVRTSRLKLIWICDVLLRGFSHMNA